MMTATDGMAASSSGSGTSSGGELLIAGGRRGPAAADLPLHVTELILRCVSPLESARHVTVCKSWAATVSARLAAPVPALYVVCTPPGSKSDRRGVVVSVPLDDDGRARSSTTPSRVRWADTNCLRCIGATTSSGRVAFASGCWCTHDVVLVDPVTGALETVRVDSAAGLGLRRGRVLALAGGGAAGDSFFAVECTTLTLFRQQAQQQGWSSCAVEDMLYYARGILAAVHCNGCFYLLHQDGRLFTVDPASPPPLRMNQLPVASLRDHFGAAFSVENDGRLLVSDGEVIFVRQLLADNVSVVAGFEVYRLDVTEQCWTKVDKLASDRALFVSPGSSFAVRASEMEGCRSNCIYFARSSHEGGKSSWSWGVYSMEDRRVLFQHVVTGPGRGVQAVWFVPRVDLGRLCKSFNNSG